MLRSNEQEFMASLTGSIEALCIKFPGAVLLAPSPSKMADELGVTKAMLYHYAPYRELLERATGLTVIHDGLVLGASKTAEPVEVDLPIVERPFDRAIKASETLSQEDRMRLIAHLALHTSQH